jgi:hypothetical protein
MARWLQWIAAAAAILSAVFWLLSAWKSYPAVVLFWGSGTWGGGNWGPPDQVNANAAWAFNCLAATFAAIAALAQTGARFPIK